MSFDRELDKTFDAAGVAVEKGVSSFWSKGIVPYFRSVSIGISEVFRKKEWKSLIVALAITILIAVGAFSFEYIYLSKIEHPFVNWLYHRQKLLPFPITIIAAFLVLTFYFSLHGKQIEKLKKRFIIAFERCGLCSRRRVINDNKAVPEYPTLLKQWSDWDGGTVFLFKNVGLPIEAWKNAKDYLVASLEMKIADIDLHNNNPGYIAIKIGGAEIPKTVDFNDDYVGHAGEHSIVVGVSKNGHVTHDFPSIPHLLIAGATGAGKTVVANGLLYQCITKLKAVCFIVDFKGGADYPEFEDIGIDIISEREKLVNLLNHLITEHKERVKLFKENRVSNIVEYNKKFPKKKLRRVFLLIDELAELTDKKSCSKDEQDLVDIVIGQLSTIARLTRSTGINLLLATQRPDANVVPGQIKNNVPGRICGYFKDEIAYRIVLDYVPNPLLPNPKQQPGRFVYSLGSEDFYIQTPYFQRQKHIDKALKMDYETGVLTLEGIQNELDGQLLEASPVASKKARFINMDALDDEEDMYE